MLQGVECSYMVGRLARSRYAALLCDLDLMFDHSVST